MKLKNQNGKNFLIPLLNLSQALSLSSGMQDLLMHTCKAPLSRLIRISSSEVGWVSTPFPFVDEILAGKGAFLKEPPCFGHMCLTCGYTNKNSCPWQQQLESFLEFPLSYW